jgi:hypothetical protein
MSRTYRFLLLVAGALLVFILYRPGVSSQFVYDDLAIIVHNPSVLDKNPLKALSFNPFRSLVYLTYDIQYHLAHHPDSYRTSTLGFHVFNLAVHLLNGIMILLLLARAGIAGRGIPFAAALLFWIHPLSTEAVNFISARFTLMASFFYLAAVYSYLDPEARKFSAFGFWLFFMLGLLCKETMATLPISLMVINHVLKRRQKWIIAALTVVALYLILRLNWTIVLSLHQDERLGPLEYFMVQNLSVWLYAWKGFFPVHLNFDCLLRPSPQALIPFLIINLFLLIVITRAALRRSAWASLPLLFIILLLPTSSFIPLDDPFRETRAYLPTSLTCLALAWLFYPQVKPGRPQAVFQVILLAVIIMLFSGLTLERNQEWRTPGTLWRDTVKKSPLKHRPVYNYGNALRRELKLKKALVQYERALSLDPDHHNTIRNIDLVKKALKSPRLEEWKEQLIKENITPSPRLRSLGDR